eukprot:scaffold5715_cov55-Attheya_sp.AAC.2
MIAFAMASGCQMYHGELTAGFSVDSSIFAQDRLSPMYCFQDERNVRRLSSLPLSSLHAMSSSSSSSSDMDSLREPNEEESPRFGRQAYWNEFYSKDSTTKSTTDSGSSTSSSSSSNNDGGGFSWYADWSDLEPFFAELVSMDSRVLIPGIGNDASMVDMYDSGYTNMVAFDYAEQGVECAKRLFGPNRHVDLAVADARSLKYETGSFDAVLEKGTLDAVYLSGGTDKERAAHYLSMAVSELARLVRPGGIVFSVTAACAPAIDHCFQHQQPADTWKQIRDGSIYITEDGFASINVDDKESLWFTVKRSKGCDRRPSILAVFVYSAKETAKRIS